MAERWSSQEDLLSTMEHNEEEKLDGCQTEEEVKKKLTGEEQVEKKQEDVDVQIENNSCLSRLRNIVTVEPVLFLYFLAFIPSFPLTQQYIHQFFTLKYNLSDTQSHAHDCSGNSSSPIEQKVQEETSQYMVYLNTANLLPSCLAVLFLGAYTDQAGRKGVLLMPLATGVFRSLIFICVIQFKLHINYLLIGNIIDGLSGGCTTVVTSCFAYIADITSEKQRSIRIYALELGISFGIALSQIYTGYMIETLGYIYPFLLTETIYVVNLLFVLAYIKDSLKPKNDVRVIDFNHLKKTVGLFIYDTENKRRWKLQLLITIVLLNYMVDIGSGDVYTFYTLASPFCFSPVLIGYFNAAQYCLRVIGSMIFLKVFEKRLKDIVMMMLGTTSGIAAQIVMVVAVTKVLVFISPVVGILTSLVIPLTRSVCSKLVEPDEQGAMSASVSMAQQVSSLLGSLIFNSVYAHTVSIYRGIVFIVTSSVYGISLLLMIVFFVQSRWEERRARTHSSNN